MSVQSSVDCVSRDNCSSGCDKVRAKLPAIPHVLSMGTDGEISVFLWYCTLWMSYTVMPGHVSCLLESLAQSLADKIKFQILSLNEEAVHEHELLNKFCEQKVDADYFQH